MLNKGLVLSEPAADSARLASDHVQSPSAASAPSPTSHTTGDLLDAKAIAMLQQLDPSGGSGFLERVLRTFQSSAARLMAKLDEARRQQDARTVHRVAHTLKSSAASIGALALAAICGRIEATLAARPGVDFEAALAAEFDALGLALDATLAAIAQRLDAAA